MRREVVVVGEKETVTGFALAGVSRLYLHSSKEETLRLLRGLLREEGVGLILLTHRVAEELGEEWRKVMREKGPFPMVLRIPDRTGYRPEKDELEEMVKRTVGAEVVVRREEG
ncbi:MAG: V-type ATP synthase subunit F [Candidatus Hadarchaeales archaeon]